MPSLESLTRKSPQKVAKGVVPLASAGAHTDRCRCGLAHTFGVLSCFIFTFCRLRGRTTNGNHKLQRQSCQPSKSYGVHKKNENGGCIFTHGGTHIMFLFKGLLLRFSPSTWLTLRLHKHKSMGLYWFFSLALGFFSGLWEAHSMCSEGYARWDYCQYLSS